jgi:hypothetical protein
MPESVVQQLAFYPSVEAIARIRAVGIVFPEICCVCARPATRTFPIQPLSLRERVQAARGRWCGAAVPHCNEHGGPFASFLFTIFYLEKCYLCVATIGLNRVFLNTLQESCRRGDIYAPWVAFPNTYGAIGWTQGENEAWMRDTWCPFWLGLSEEDRKSYLKRWKANPMWCEFLLDDPRWHPPPQQPQNVS